jgi:hypothetical protein
MERLSGSVSEICWSGVAKSCFSMASSLAISDFSFVSFSLQAGLLQLDRFRPFLPVGGVELRQITRDALLQLRAPPFDLSLREILVSIVDRLELAAIDGHGRFASSPILRHYVASRTISRKFGFGPFFGHISRFTGYIALPPSTPPARGQEP